MEQALVLTQRRIFRFWGPLAATWLMMSVEGPFVAAIIARLPEPKQNLAAFGVAFAFAMIIESPIIMMLSAATALVRDRMSFLALRRFAYLMNLGITGLMAFLLMPPVFHLVTQTLIGLPDPVARLAHGSTALMLLWPAAIGYRRFYQGVLIRHGLTRRVAYGTVVRLMTMAVVAGAGYLIGSMPGAWVGGAALAMGVTAEAVASRAWAAQAVRSLCTERAPSGPPLTMDRIVGFYTPLALTSVLTLAVNPLVTFFLGRSRLPLDSLAILPVVTGLVFAFRSVGIAYQEVGITLLGDRREGLAPLARFATLLAVASSASMTAIAFSPLARLWFEHVAGLSEELADFAILPLRLLAVMPALEVLLSFQRSLLVHARQTRRITAATTIEVAGIVAILAVAIGGFDAVGAVAASAAFLIGRLTANIFLMSSPATTSPGGSPPQLSA